MPCEYPGMVNSHLTFKHQVEKVCQILKSTLVNFRHLRNHMPAGNVYLFSNVHEEHLTGEHSEKHVCMLIWRNKYVTLEMLNNKRQLQRRLQEGPLDWVQWCSVSSSRCVDPLQVYGSSRTWAQQHLKSPQFNTWLTSRDKESTHSHL